MHPKFIIISTLAYYQFVAVMQGLSRGFSIVATLKPLAVWILYKKSLIIKAD